MTHPAQRSSNDDEKVNSTFPEKRMSLEHHRERRGSGERTAYRDPIDAVERDPSLSSELIDREWNRRAFHDA